MGSSQGPFEVDAGPLKPLALVETVRVCAVLGRVEVELAGAAGTPELGEPPEQGGSVSAGPSFGQRDEIVDVHEASPGEALTEAKTGDGHEIATIPERRELVARAFLCAD